MKLRPADTKTSKLFLGYRNGKCIKQVVGKGMIGQFPKKIAEYLKLPNIKSYTGHSFRRTSATFLANGGVDILGLKRHGGWKSSTVAESYVEDSIQNKIEFANKILHSNNSDKPSTSTQSDSYVSSDQGSEVNSFPADAATLSGVDTVTKNISDTDKSIPVFNINNCSNCTFNVVINK